MEIKYRLMYFDMPEYCGGNCDTIGIFDKVEDALKAQSEEEINNENDNVFYHIVIDVNEANRRAQP